MKALFIIGVGFAAFAAVLGFWKILTRRQERSLLDRMNAIPSSYKTMDYSGFRFWREPGLTTTGEQQNSIEDGLVRAFRKAECAGYTKAIEAKDYTIVFLKGTRDILGYPALRIPAGEYRGTEWDQGDGTMLVAGQMLDPVGGFIAIPEYGNEQRDLDHLAEAIEHEAEHVILWHNDRGKYEQTKFHAPGHGHPIIPDCPPKPEP